MSTFPLERFNPNLGSWGKTLYPYPKRIFMLLCLTLTLVPHSGGQTPAWRKTTKSQHLLLISDFYRDLSA